MLIMFDNAINILILAIIAYSFKASIAQVTFLHFIELMCMIFLVKVNSAIPSDSMLITNTNSI